MDKVTWQGFLGLFGQMTQGISYFSAASVHLFTNDIQPDLDTDIPDMEEAVFTGYPVSAPLATVGMTTDLNEAGEFEVVFPHIVFQPTAVLAAAVTIRGWYVVGEAGDALTAPHVLFAGRLPEDVILESQRDIVIVEPRLRLAQSITS